MSRMSKKKQSNPNPTNNATPPGMPGTIEGRESTIVVDHVSKWYGDIVAVSDVSFGVPPGVTALLGPNGAGKSTCLKMMAGLHAPSAGKITILGEPARGHPKAYKNI